MNVWDIVVINMTNNKFNARITPYMGYLFGSGKECARFKELLLLENAGEITNLVVHPKYLLQDGFKYHGKKILPITYTADFSYYEFTEGGSYVVEDVKGGKATQTALFKAKVKMLKNKFPEIDFRIVEA